MASKSEKFIEEISAMSVLELSELVKAIETAFGVSAAAPVAVASAGAAAPAAEAAAEKSEFKVTLKDVGAKKVDVIRALRKIKKDLGVTEAKGLVESAPVVIEAAAAKDVAQEMKKELEAAGATVELA